MATGSAKQEATEIMKEDYQKTSLVAHTHSPTGKVHLSTVLSLTLI